MGKISMDGPGNRWDLEGWSESNFDQIGDWVVSIERDLKDEDLAWCYAGAPNDRCQCHHLGYVIKGRFAVRKADGSEDVFAAGDAFVVEPDHTPIQFAGGELVSFTPAQEMAGQASVVMGNVTRYAAQHGIAIPPMPSLA